MPTKKTRVLVCGGTGFIGRNMLEYFGKREDCVVTATYHKTEPVGHPQVEMVKADLTNPDDVKKIMENQDVVIQAAATTSGANDIVNRPYLHVTDNALMNSLLFKEAFEAKIKHMIFFSCTVMYHSQEEPLKESDYDANRDIYPKYFGVGWTKVYLEKMCEFFSSISDTKFTAIRHSNIYGPYDKYDLVRSHVFGATVAKVMDRSKDEIVVWGAGEEKRDLLYVDDLVSLVDLIVQKQKNPFELVNAGLGEAVAIKDLVAKVVDASGRDLKISYDTSKPTLKTSLCLDCSKAKKEFSWS